MVQFCKFALILLLVTSSLSAPTLISFLTHRRERLKATSTSNPSHALWKDLKFRKAVVCEAPRSNFNVGVLTESGRLYFPTATRSQKSAERYRWCLEGSRTGRWTTNEFLAAATTQCESRFEKLHQACHVQGSTCTCRKARSLCTHKYYDDVLQACYAGNKRTPSAGSSLWDGLCGTSYESLPFFSKFCPPWTAKEKP